MKEVSSFRFEVSSYTTAEKVSGFKLWRNLKPET
jgi:hypothetical protein